ncbi:MAG: hypothetical protein AAFY60_22085, partial [Myxococcota bacterium]
MKRVVIMALLGTAVAACSRGGFRVADPPSADLNVNSNDNGNNGQLFTSAVLPTFAGFDGWNDYVATDDSASARACDPAVDDLEDCVHAGSRRSVTVQTDGSCEEFVGRDALSAFHWQCSPGTDGLVFNATGLSPGVRLADLLD